MWKVLLKQIKRRKVDAVLHCGDQAKKKSFAAVTEMSVRNALTRRFLSRAPPGIGILGPQD